MTLKSLFIRKHDGSACGGGMCRHDERCTSNCEGHPKNYGVEAALPIEMYEPPKVRKPIDWMAWIENTAGIAFLAFVGGGVVWCAFQVVPYFIAALSTFR